MANEPQECKADKKNKIENNNSVSSTSENNCGVGIGGDVLTQGGDFVGRDKIDSGDKVNRDKVGHDVFYISAGQVIIYQGPEGAARKSPGEIFDSTEGRTSVPNTILISDQQNSTTEILDASTCVDSITTANTSHKHAYDPIPYHTRRLELPIEFDWIVIPAGEFLMGSDRKNDFRAYDSEVPQHVVYLPEYRIARVPVTVAQFEEFIKATNYKTKDELQDMLSCINSPWEDTNRSSRRQHKIQSDIREKALHPIIGVTWQDALMFCQWADVRLPTEAEWEKAARGDDGRLWPWGNEQPNENRCNFNSSIKDTTPVGKYPEGASPYGVLDMVGNVWEWTSSLFKSYPYKSNDGREDLTAQGDRTLRGGSFDFDIDFIRCAARSVEDTECGLHLVGFRVIYK